MAGAFYNQSSYFRTKQRVSSLLLFHVNIASESNVIPEMVSSYNYSMVQSTDPQDVIQAAQYFTNSLLLWCYLELFIVCLAAFTTQITTADKQTRLVINAVLEVFIILRPAMLAYNYRPKFIR